MTRQRPLCDLRSLVGEIEPRRRDEQRLELGAQLTRRRVPLLAHLPSAFSTMGSSRGSTSGRSSRERRRLHREVTVDHHDGLSARNGTVPVASS